jgi:hypothetical protein
VDEITMRGGIQPDGQVRGIIRINEAELQGLREKQVAIQSEIRNFLKDQNKDTDRREMIIMWVNILGVPLLLVAFGIVLAIYRSSLRAAH